MPLEYERTLDTQSDVSDYLLDSTLLHDLTKRLLERQPSPMADKYICFEVDGQDPLSNVGRHIERVRFEKTFGNTADDMAREYGPYEHASTFFISVDREDEAPAGVLRIIRNSAVGLKTINDVAGPPLHLSKEHIMAYHNIDTLDDCWDIGTVATMPEQPSATASIQAYRAMYLAADRDNVKHFISVIDAKALSQLSGYLGIPFQALVDTPPFEYLGSDRSQAVYGHVSDLFERANNKRATVRDNIARTILGRLFGGTEDHTIILNDYKK